MTAGLPAPEVDAVVVATVLVERRQRNSALEQLGLAALGRANGAPDFERGFFEVR